MSGANRSAVVSTRTTFDGVTVFLHADGSVSDRLRFVGGGRLPVANMWRAWGDVCVYTHAELPAMIRATKRPAPKSRRVRPLICHERHVLSNGLVRWFGVYGKAARP